MSARPGYPADNTSDNQSASGHERRFSTLLSSLAPSRHAEDTETRTEDTRAEDTETAESTEDSADARPTFTARPDRPAAHAAPDAADTPTPAEATPGTATAQTVPDPDMVTTPGTESTAYPETGPGTATESDAETRPGTERAPDSNTAPGTETELGAGAATPETETGPGTGAGLGSATAPQPRPIRTASQQAADGLGPTAETTAVPSSAPAQAFPQPAAAEEPLLGDAAGLRARWQHVQAGFVEDPHEAVTEAANLVEQTAQDLVSALRERQQQLRGTWERGEGSAADTEQLRLMMQRYRALFNQLCQP